MSIAIYVLVMAGVTYLIRMVPFTFFRKKITSRFWLSFLHYIPYAVLSAMTIPAIFYSTGSMVTAAASTGSMVTAAAGTIVALVMAYFELPLIAVALGASAAAFITGLIL
ncbi:MULTISPECIES: AzlD domain-containing protein [Ruminococcus]|uniref:Branched-chain amino acid transport n=1 Tax=Ruminococcus albus (strain ATCC 27210 / DSM 20455 / JCM 14654 / NCDO 2250 / 7) TaxID=697329 RepID=E6UEA3_RUMA7|nr:MULTISPECIES: AzlD domain-containing protein [Ruminococcus]ADU23493.1 branched-chain amino acid transport [Ruminococcus albus 7 = DSM 20455]MCR5020983.1 AzlD domain-containing protein [Ruminococcus sp.]